METQTTKDKTTTQTAASVAVSEKKIRSIDDLASYVREYLLAVWNGKWSVGTLTYTIGGLAAVFFWLLWGDFSFFLKERSVPNVMQLLLDTFHAKNVTAGFLIGSLPQLIAIFLSPVISYRSDRHRGRWGRRIPYLFIPTPIAFLSMIGLAYSPRIGEWLHTALGAHSLGRESNIIMCLGVFWALFEICSIICNSVLAALVNDVVPRQLIGRFFALFRMFSLAAGMGFSWYLMGKMERYYGPIFIGIGTLYLISFSAMCFFVKEGTYPPIENTPMELAGTQTGIGNRIVSSVVGCFESIGNYFTECFSHPYYRWYFLSITLAGMAFQPANLFTLFYAKSVGMSMKTLGEAYTVQLGCSFFIAFPLGWLADKFHPLRVTIVATALYALSTGLAFVFVNSPHRLYLAVIICGVMAGCWLTATAILAPAILPKGKFATLASASAVCQAIGVMAMSTVCGFILDHLNRNYRFVYLFCSLMMATALWSTVVVYRKFMALGGPEGYVAPE